MWTARARAAGASHRLIILFLIIVIIFVADFFNRSLISESDDFRDGVEIHRLADEVVHACGLRDLLIRVLRVRGAAADVRLAYSSREAVHHFTDLPRDVWAIEIVAEAVVKQDQLVEIRGSCCPSRLPPAQFSDNALGCLGPGDSDVEWHVELLDDLAEDEDVHRLIVHKQYLRRIVVLSGGIRNACKALVARLLALHRHGLLSLLKVQNVLAALTIALRTSVDQRAPAVVRRHIIVISDV